MKILTLEGLKYLVDWIKKEIPSAKLIHPGTGKGSVCIGKECDANGDSAHAEGVLSSADGIGSHAEGLNAYSFGIGSHAEGCGTSAVGPYSHAAGVYCKPGKSQLHVIGCGYGGRYRNSEVTYYTPIEDRDNLNFPSNKEGYKYLIGIGGYDGTNLFTDQEGTQLNPNVKSVQEVIEELVSRIAALESPIV